MRFVRTWHLATSHGLPTLAALSFLVLSLHACEPNSSHQVDDAALAPRLLDDRAEIATYIEAFPHEDYTIYDVPDVGRFYMDDEPQAVKNSLRKGVPWEQHVIRLFEQYVIPGSVVLDVGAHIGSHTVTLARLVGPTGHVYAFEPQKRVYRELVYNLKLNEIRNATPLRFAASSQAGVLGSNPRHLRVGPVGRGLDRVEARTIDSFKFDNVSVMKIDVDGHQLEVLQGAKETIAEQEPVIVIEIYHGHVEETKQLLRAYGYEYQHLRRHDYLAKKEDKL